MSDTRNFNNPAIDVPECFSRKQWDEWMEVAMSRPPSERNGYCEDCTPEYRDKMKASGKCAYPNTIFVRDKDGFVYGKRVFDETLQSANKARRARKLATDIEAA